jgi:3-methyladenine DNA glycosylase Mpg
MRSFAALLLGLLFTGAGLYGGAVITPLAYPAAFTAQGHTSNTVALFVMLGIAAVFTAFGGWVTARLVSDHRRGHAILMSAVGLVAAVLVGAVRWAAAPSWYYATLWMMMPFAAALGASAWERSLRRSSRDVSGQVAAAR